MADRSKADEAAEWSNKEVSLANTGKISQAIACYDRAIELDPNLSAAWYNKGYALSRLDKLKEAIECYDRALTISPDIDNIWVNKGASLSMLSLNQEALTCFEKALELNPNISISLSHLWMDSKLRLYICTSGWSYSSWQGKFYPEKLEQKWCLPYYSQVFLFCRC